MHPRSKLAIVSVALVFGGCAKPTSPTIDEVIDEFRQLNNESTQLSCQCFELLIDDYANEQECVNHAGLIEDDDLDCIAGVAESVTRDEDEAIALVQCYNAAFRELVDCERTNVGVCSAEIFGDCVEAFVSATTDCAVGYPEDELESLWYCWP